MMRALVGLVLSATLGACASQDLSEDYFDGEDASTQLKTIFDNKYAVLTQHMDLLAVVGAKACLPGRLRELEREFRTIQLQRQAGLWPEAVHHMAEAADALEKLQCQLQVVQQTTSCAMPVANAMSLTQWNLYKEDMNCSIAPPVLLSDVSDEVPSIIVIEPALFALDSAELNTLAQQVLTEHYSKISKQNNSNVRITGHADSQGDELYNLGLSLERAQSVADFLVDLGLDKNSIDVVAMGEKSPRVSELGDMQRQLNRRVIVEFIRY